MGLQINRQRQLQALYIADKKNPVGAESQENEEEIKSI